MVVCGIVAGNFFAVRAAVPATLYDCGDTIVVTQGIYSPALCGCGKSECVGSN